MDFSFWCQSPVSGKIQNRFCFLFFIKFEVMVVLMIGATEPSIKDFQERKIKAELVELILIFFIKKHSNFPLFLWI